MEISMIGLSLLVTGKWAMTTTGVILFYQGIWHEGDERRDRILAAIFFELLGISLGMSLL